MAAPAQLRMLLHLADDGFGAGVEGTNIILPRCARAFRHRCVALLPPLLAEKLIFHKQTQTLNLAPLSFSPYHCKLPDIFLSAKIATPPKLYLA